MELPPSTDVPITEPIVAAISVPRSTRIDTEAEQPRPRIVQNFPMFNRFQLWLERRFRTEIVWWPLPTPQRTILCPPGFQEVLWRCKCGSEFIRLVPANAGQGTIVSNQGPSTSATVTGNAQGFQHHRQSSSASSTASSSSPRSSLHNRGPQYATHPNYPPNPNPDYLILCVDLPFNRNRLGCVLLLDGNKNDQQFFTDLKRSYYKLRCWHRLYVFLTFRTLSHFKFVRMRQFLKRETRILCSNAEELPGQQNQDYDCITKGQQIPPTPIPREELKHYFDHPEDADDADDQQLQLFPKRLKGCIPNEEREVWGLQAVHGPSAAMFLLFGVLILAAFAGFVYWWLKNHPWDLQNAFTPPGAACAFIATGGVLLQMYQQGGQVP